MVLARLPCSPLVVDPCAIGVALLATFLCHAYFASSQRKHFDVRGLPPNTVRRRRVLFRVTQSILRLDLAKIAVGLCTVHVVLFVHELSDLAIRNETNSEYSGGAYYLPSHAMRTLIDVILTTLVATLFPWRLAVRWIGRRDSVMEERGCCNDCRDAMVAPGRYSHSVLLNWDEDACLDFRTERDGAEAQEDDAAVDEDVRVNDRLQLVRPVVNDAYTPLWSWWCIQTGVWCLCLALTAGACIVPQLLLLWAAKEGDPVSLFLRYVVPDSMTTVVCGKTTTLGIDWKEDSVLVGGSWAGMLVGHLAVDMILVCWLHWMLQFKGRITHKAYGDDEPAF